MNRTRNRRHGLRWQPQAESLEARRVLSTQAISVPLPPGPALVARSPGVSVRSVTAAQDASVAVFRTGESVYGYHFTMVNGQAAYAYDLTAGPRAVGTTVGVNALDVPTGATLQLQVLNGLTYWDGRGATPNFRPVAGNVELNLQAFGQDLRVGAKTDQTTAPRGGVIRLPLDLAVSDGLPLHRSIEITAGVGGTRDRFAKVGAPAGLYAFTGLWRSVGANDVRDSAPLTFVFRIGNVPDAARDTALQGFADPVTRPAAVVALSAERVEPTGPGSEFLRIFVEYSSPVSVQGAPPQLPLLFDRTLRLANLERNTPQVGTNVLTYTYTLLPQDRRAVVVRPGDSLRVGANSSLRTVGGTPAILSLPTAALRPIQAPSAGVFTTISADITRNTTWRQGSTYIIDGEVHVRSGVTLTIEDGVTVLIRNGYRPRTRMLDTSALIFDSGSGLRAKTVTFGNANADNRSAAFGNNGGVFFLGTYRQASKEGVTNDISPAAGRSRFIADRLIFNAVGRTDPRGGDGNNADRDDIDAVSLLGLQSTEWQVKAVETTASGDDGFDVTNSSIAMDSLSVAAPVGDGLNISSSTVDIRSRLSVVMTNSRVPDRELFDLEVDDGPSRINISRLAFVDLRGYWGPPRDEVNLSSPDMPKPPRRGTEDVWYEFTGTLRKGPAIIYSLNVD